LISGALCEWYTKSKTGSVSSSRFIPEGNRNMKNKPSTKISYDPDADVLSMETSGRSTIDHAEEMGDLIVHFSKRNKPVLVEILEASRLFKDQSASLRTTIRQTLVASS
jgi:uncharacterized protein YuzE